MQKIEHLATVGLEQSHTSAACRTRDGVLRTTVLSLLCTAAIGCTTNGEQSASTEPLPATSSPTPEPYQIPIFADLEFSQHLGDVAAYDIICVYRKDKDVLSIQPENAWAYQVLSTDPFGARGFVDPQRAGLVSGYSPECEVPPYPGPIPENSPAPRPSTRA